MMKTDSYEAPLVRDLEELGLKGQFPLGADTCTPSGTDTGCSVGDISDTCMPSGDFGVCGAGDGGL
jgi:hypothetical protein